MNFVVFSVLTIILSGGLQLFAQPSTESRTPMPPETQLTRDAWGHTLNNTQVFSPDDQWIVYDTRNLDAELGKTCCVRMLNGQTGEDRLLYRTQNQTEHGPGVGAAAFSPAQQQRVLFLHGLRNANAEFPYAMTRRTGVAIDIAHPQKPHFLDGRNVTPPFTSGALRGGTHAHQWSGDGTRISFTYNDAVLERLAAGNPAVADLRTVGVLIPGKSVQVSGGNDKEEFSGEGFAVVVARVAEGPRPGSDEIDRAFDETWLGRAGYRKPNGIKQRYALAFQGNVRNAAGQTVTEVFVADLPEDLTQPIPGQPLAGGPSTRPNPPTGVKQRRITFTKRGIEGPRHWLRTTPDGASIGFLTKDASDRIQLFVVSPNGGAVRQLTQQPFSIQTPFNFSPDGNFVAYAADNSIFITDLRTNEPQRLTPRSTDEDRPVNGVIWSNKGDRLVYNRYVDAPQGRYLQIFQLKMW